jgi:aerobic carbon-monoxide dehydrogenase medium subunit
MRRSIAGRAIAAGNGSPRVKPARFEYDAPRSLEEALDLLRRHGDAARLLAGGQSLIPLMNFRLAAPARIIDLNRIPELDYIKREGDIVCIGAMTRQRKIEFSEVVAKALPLLRDAIKLVGHLPTRTRGTIGGSLAHADPAAEIPMVLRALETRLVLRSSRGERIVEMGNFFRSALTTCLEPDEILTEVRIPAMPQAAGHAVEEFARRHGDFAITAVAAIVAHDGDRCTLARLAAGGVNPVPLRLGAAERLLIGRALDDRVIAAAAETVAAAVEPMSDRNGSAGFRRHLARVLARRAVQRAAAAAREKQRDV